MSRNPDSTLPSRRIPAIVVVAPAAGLLTALESVVLQLDEVPRVKAASLTEAATVVADWRPFAIVVPSEVLAFDPREFGALARDVGADVIASDTDADAQGVARALLPALTAALARWRMSRFAEH